MDLKETHKSSVMINHADLCTPSYIITHMQQQQQHFQAGNNNMTCHDNKETGDIYCYFMACVVLQL